MKVEEVMVKDPVVASIPGTRSDVLKTLIKHNITGLPAVKKDGTLAGTITRADIFSNPNEEQLAVLMDNVPPTLKPDDPIEEAAHIMFSSQTGYHIPVIDKDRKLLGIVSPTDLMLIVEKRDIDVPIEKYITNPCVPIFQETPLNVALRIIRLSKVFALPVLDTDARLCGIITDRDLFKLSYIDKKRVLTKLGVEDDEDDWTWEGLRNVIKLYYEESKVDLPNVHVKEVMIKDPTSVFLRTSVSKCARLMRKYDFAQLPIRDDEDRLIAMAYELDVISALYKRPPPVEA